MGTDVTYMINLDYPHPLNKMGEYILLVGMVSEDIRQIRFDFIDFNLVSAAMDTHTLEKYLTCPVCNQR